MKNLFQKIYILTHQKPKLKLTQNKITRNKYINLYFKEMGKYSCEKLNKFHKLILKWQRKNHYAVWSNLLKDGVENVFPL